MKKVRVNRKYGEWFYEKQFDFENSKNYMYYIYGKDNKGCEWNWSTPYYNEILDFIKSNDNEKLKYMKF